MPTTRLLLDRLHTDIALRRLSGWERISENPKEWTFSRAFAEFSKSQLPERIHETFITNYYRGVIDGHHSRDSTAINAREKPIKKQPVEKPAKQRGRPKKGEVHEKTLTRIEQQAAGMTVSKKLDDLPTVCDVGTKKNSKGYKTSWTVYKLHIDSADGGIPISCVLTSASMHDSQKMMCHLMFGILALTVNQMLCFIE